MSAVVAQKKSVINWKSRSSPETEPIDVYIQICLKELVQTIVSVASLKSAGQAAGRMLG